MKMALHGHGLSVLLVVIAISFQPARVSGGLFDFFDTPEVEPLFADVMLRGGREYLDLKEDAFVVEALDDKVLMLGRPIDSPLEAGERLVEVRGYFDSVVRAMVDFDDGAGFSYKKGDSLTMRVYCAGMFVVSAENAILRHRYKIIALRNMNNPANEEEFFTLVAELPEQQVFEPGERVALLFPDRAEETQTNTSQTAQ
jgi:hypothetical protein